MRSFFIQVGSQYINKIKDGLVTKFFCLVLFMTIILIPSLMVKANDLSSDHSTISDVEVLFVEIPEYISNGDFQTAIDVGTEYLEEHPDDPTINWHLGEAYLRMSMPFDALPYFQRVSELLPDDKVVLARAKYFSALCYYYSGDTNKARNTFYECLRIDGDAEFSGYAEQMLSVLNLTPYFDSWNIVESDHFTFHFHPVFTAEERDEYSKKHEEAYVIQNEVLHSEPIKKIDEFVWDSEESLISIKGSGIKFSSPNTCIINSMYTVTAGHLTSYILVFWMEKPDDLLNVDISIRNSRFIDQGTGVYFNNQDPSEKSLDILKVKLLVRNGLRKKLDVKDQWENDEIFDMTYPSRISQVIAGDFIDYLVQSAGIDKYRLLLSDPSFTNASMIYRNELFKIINEFESKYARNYLLFIIPAAIIILFVLIMIIKKRVRIKNLFQKGQ